MTLLNDYIREVLSIVVVETCVPLHKFLKLDASVFVMKKTEHDCTSFTASASPVLDNLNFKGKSPSKEVGQKKIVQDCTSSMASASPVLDDLNFKKNNLTDLDQDEQQSAGPCLHVKQGSERISDFFVEQDDDLRTLSLSLDLAGSGLRESIDQSKSKASIGANIRPIELSQPSCGAVDSSFEEIETEVQKPAQKDIQASDLGNGPTELPQPAYSAADSFYKEILAQESAEKERRASAETDRRASAELHLLRDSTSLIRDSASRIDTDYSKPTLPASFKTDSFSEVIWHGLTFNVSKYSFEIDSHV
jgi:hypothetical protein